mgnify:FL=1
MRKQVKTDLFKPLFINVLQNIFPGSGEETAPRSRRVRSPEPRTLLPGAGTAESLPGVREAELTTGSIYSDVIIIQTAYFYCRVFILYRYFTTEVAEGTEFKSLLKRR